MFEILEYVEVKGSYVSRRVCRVVPVSRERGGRHRIVVVIKMNRIRERRRKSRETA